MDPAERDALERASRSDDRSMSALARKIIAEWLRANGWIANRAKPMRRLGRGRAAPDETAEEPEAVTPTYEDNGAWWFVSDSLHDDVGNFVGGDELRGPFATKQQADIAWHAEINL